METATMQGWRAHVASTLALDLSPSLVAPGADPRPSFEFRQRIETIRRALTLQRRNAREGESPAVPFWIEEPGWLHTPRGWLLTRDGQTLLNGFAVEDGRSGGYSLPPGLRCRTTFGVPPYPSGQPQFIEDIVTGCQRNGHGGLALAPTRAGKTLCSIEAAARLGGSTLILVDRSVLLRQWVEVIEGAHGLGIKAGVIQQDRFDTPPQYPFVVAMVETLARRALPDDFRTAFRTVIVDECQSAPTDTTWVALSRVASSYVIGLTATPDRKDGLGDAVFWTTGPVLAELRRQLEADVFFLHLPFRHKPVPKETPAGIEMKKPRIVRPNGMANIVGIEQSLAADPERVNFLADEYVRAERDGRRVLVFVGLREHVAAFHAAFKHRGRKAGVFIGGHDDKSEMKHDLCVTTFQMASKGIDFMPPYTLVAFAAPRGDVRQAMGRGLNPQAPCKTMILDAVDGQKTLVGMAQARCRQYREKGFDVLNVVWPGGDPDRWPIPGGTP